MANRQQGIPFFISNNNQQQLQPQQQQPMTLNQFFVDNLLSHNNNTFSLGLNSPTGFSSSPVLPNSGYGMLPTQGSQPVYLFASPHASTQISLHHHDQYYNMSCQCIVKFDELKEGSQYPIFPTDMFKYIEPTILDGVAMEGVIHVPLKDFHYLHAWCIHTVIRRMGIPTLQMPVGNFRKIGKGGFGFVYRISQDRVLKIVDDKNNSGWKEALKRFCHPHLLELKEAFMYPGGGLVLLVYPFMKHGTLRNREFTLTQIWKVIWQLANGLEHLHHNNIVHRDIKLDNVLIEEIDEYENIKVVLSDFGLSRNMDSCSSGAAGTDGYVPPELLESGEVASDETDIFSLGKTVSTMCLGELIPGFIKFKPRDSLTDLLNRMMDKKPHCRPSTREIQEICLKELKLLNGKRYFTKFKLDKSSLESNTPLPKISSNESKLFMTDDLEESLSRMSISNSKKSKVYEINGETRYLSSSSCPKTVDAMSMSDTKSKPRKTPSTKEKSLPNNETEPIKITNFITTTPTPTVINKKLTPQQTDHKYSFKLHKDGCVDAKRIIQIECDSQARKAIKSLKLQVKNSKSSTGLLDVTPNIEKENDNSYVISKSQKTSLLKNVQFEGERGKDVIELYINDTLKDKAPYVAKN
ncbi:serine/threonine protein kinase [Naegleria gruberi]|uniref:non-specific serine/threonine protein kinase n=1 Tax=Naegleria gruberi TaxID=5762 RepID=D2V5L3_NAEGR|nr:serine/threonine protein kinase [Naegleria gruberi]EFC47820.1 serine/threonine protein kinase [Naegleria gruberi]|eukprot:XP_002680564.1 serine/threonine protein kinase [Naegleria gruberi strain NEG-M]